MPKRKHKKKPLIIKCPCCGNVVDKNDVKWVLHQMKLESGRWLSDLIDEIPMEWLQEDGNWACDTCVKKGKVVKANFYKQNYCLSGNFYVYRPEFIECESCQDIFVFGASEQKYWYETLGFIVYSKPKKCKKCYRKRNEARIRNTQLSDLLKRKDLSNIHEVNQVIEIYAALGKKEKVKYFQSVKRKLEKCTSTK